MTRSGDFCCNVQCNQGKSSHLDLVLYSLPKPVKMAELCQLVTMLAVQKAAPCPPAEEADGVLLLE